MDDSNSLFKLECRVIDKYCTFNYLLSYNNQYFPEREQKVFCPFHDNHDTPAAKLYKDEEGECIFCYAENKLYKPHHLLTKKIVDFTTNHVFSAIWANLSDSERAFFNEDIPQNLQKDFSSSYLLFRKGKISYFDLLEVLRNG